jgi:hypothetical protein
MSRLPQNFLFIPSVNEPPFVLADAASCHLISLLNSRVIDTMTSRFTFTLEDAVATAIIKPSV